MSYVSFDVYNRAEPQGSKKGLIHQGKGIGEKARALVVDVSKVKLRSYRSEVTREAMIALRDAGLPELLAGKHVPVEIIMEFQFMKRSSVPKRRIFPSVKPDIDKLQRATLDALTGVMFQDDGQVVRAIAEKNYGPIDMVRISIHTLETNAKMF